MIPGHKDRQTPADIIGLIMAKKEIPQGRCGNGIPVERRSGLDRRRRSFVSALFWTGPRRRRSPGRRITDTGGYVDIYDGRTWSITIGVLILSLADALLTGYHLLRGSAAELNPLMKTVLDQGGLTAFLLLKAMMTIVPMTIIMIHKEWALGRYAARICLWAYILVSLYHMYLIFALYPVQVRFFHGA